MDSDYYLLGKSALRECAIGWEANMPLIFHEEVWFMSFSEFHNVILKWKLKMKMYEVDIRVLIL